MFFLDKTGFYYDISIIWNPNDSVHSELSLYKELVQI